MTNRDRFSPGRATGPLWERWCQAATPEQRQQALALARQSGFVPARLLPSFDGTEESCILGRLLAGDAAPLPSADAPALEPLDPALDDCQRRAAARALASPDVALIVGPVGTGKTRVAAELVAQCLARGQRVLLASGSALGAQDRKSVV